MHITTLLNAINQTNIVKAIDPTDLASPIGNSLQTVVTELTPILPIYTSILPTNSVYPSAVIDLTSSTRWGDDSFEMFTTDYLIVTIYADSLTTLIPKLEQIKTALQAYNQVDLLSVIEIKDTQLGYISDKKLRTASIEIEISYLNLASQQLPVSFVYYTNINAIDPQTQQPKQLASYVFSTTIVCEFKQLKQVQANIKQQLTAQQINHRPIIYKNGSRIMNFGRYVIWQDFYQYNQII